MKNNSNLRLNLKSKWYDLIESGVKKEEYREIKEYWIKRLCWREQRDQFGCKCTTCNECFERTIDSDDWVAEPYETVTFVYGYTKREMTFKIEDIVVGYGNPDWGADKGTLYFVIKIGERLK